MGLTSLALKLGRNFFKGAKVINCPPKADALKTFLKNAPKVIDNEPLALTALKKGIVAPIKIVSPIFNKGVKVDLPLGGMKMRMLYKA